ncbi:MAG TPA: NAD-binding protein, partial [Parasegetibacter sp.]
MASLKDLAKKYLLIGVSGHRDLIPEDYAYEPDSSRYLNTKVRQILQDIRNQHPEQIPAIITCLAEGADLLVAYVAAELGIRIIPVVPDSNQKIHASAEAWENCKRILFSDLTLAEKNQQASFKHSLYEESAELVASFSNYLLALWDGVDTGLPGGTSDIIRIMLHGKDNKNNKVVGSQRPERIFSLPEIKSFRKKRINPKGKIIHIRTRRQINPYPISRPEYFQTAKEPQISSDIEIAVFPAIEQRSGIRKIIRQVNNYLRFNNLLWNFLFPIFLALMTIVFGTIGFNKVRAFEAWQSDSSAKGMQAEIDTLAKYNLHINEADAKTQVINTYQWNYPLAFNANDFYNSVNLITFNSSVFDSEKIHWTQELARWLALIAVVSGFALALIAALGSNFKTELALLKLRILRLFIPRKKYHLIIGATPVSFHLAADIRRRKELVVLLDKEPDNHIRTDAIRSGIHAFTGNPQTASTLRRLHAHRANEIYIFSEDDSENINCYQELDQICSRMKKRVVENAKWFIHLKEERLHDLVKNTDKLTKTANAEVVNIYENIARRLLLRYPPDQFDPKKRDQIAEVIVFGNSDMAQQIVLTALRQSQYNRGNKIKITWFIEGAEEFQSAFLRRYPCMDFEHDSTVFGRPYAREIRDKLFYPDTISFRELPVADSAYFNDGVIYQAIQKEHTLRIYFCFDDGIASSAYLNAIARKIKPKLAEGRITSLNLHLFCFYHQSDENNVRHISWMSNKVSPYTPVTFFGMLAEECTWKAINERTLDKLPMLINLWFTKPSLFRDETNHHPDQIIQYATEVWNELSESHKESSRHAADHLWVKLRLMNIPADQLIPGEFILSHPEFAKTVEELAVTEHYRWCRERLLNGYIPLQDIELNYHS